MEFVTVSNGRKRTMGQKQRKDGTLTILDMEKLLISKATEMVSTGGCSMSLAVSMT